MEDKIKSDLGDLKEYLIVCRGSGTSTCLINTFVNSDDAYLIVLKAERKNAICQDLNIKRDSKKANHIITLHDIVKGKAKYFNRGPLLFDTDVLGHIFNDSYHKIS
jgi:hypothetical protein